jgi:hypothetical protein
MYPEGWKKKKMGEEGKKKKLLRTERNWDWRERGKYVKELEGGKNR